MGSVRLNSVMPSMPVSGLDMAVAFYTEKLGFKVTFRNGDLFAIVSRDGVEIGLAPVAVHKRTPGTGGIYLKASGVDALHTDLVAKGVAMLHPLRDEAYGMREFMIADPDGNTINYGEPC